ncbi:flavodoxin domain-containing protein [Geodermatophilus sp. FMUSA9-8]|uniref:flavodoxin domain-containing protein n=1 Tax=Geodermatophilus sp. FMUSA9-8 TaxID=3120155 RepID=UPI0030083EA3
MDEIPTRVLVGYATAGGSTREVAERVAHVLGEAGLDVDVRQAGTDVDPEGYAAAVVGSAVHSMRWLPGALDLLHRLSDPNTRRPVWCFSVAGIAPRGRVTRWLARQERARVEQGFPAGAALRGHRLFAGVVRIDGVPLWGRAFYRVVGQHPGDHRDWAAIDRWSRQVATDVLGRATVAAADGSAPPAGDRR